MRLYTCDQCHNLLYFENHTCLKCGTAIGFDPEKLDLISVAEDQNDNQVFVDSTNHDNRYRFCSNKAHGTCNWLIVASDVHEFCLACQLNRTIPFLSPTNVDRWNRIEVAKHRLVYSLLRLKLPIQSKTDFPETGLAFDFLADVSGDNHVMTGHVSGVITLNIEEADEAERVKNKLDLGERYRTLLGHFRHEIGHYYWDVLVQDSEKNTFRNLFGDETADYEKSLKQYYDTGAPGDWGSRFISPYASAHPWEDWAECWSHYLHMMDALETAFYFGIGVHPEKLTGVSGMAAEQQRDPYTIKDFDQLFALWIPLTFAVNSLNRSMGHSDFYPFVVAPQVTKKLSFIHNICRSAKVSSEKVLIQ